MKSSNQEVQGAGEVVLDGRSDEGDEGVEVAFAQRWGFEQLAAQGDADTGAGRGHSGTRATYRSKLLRLREAVIGTGCATGKPVKLSAGTASRPYINAELAALWAWARGQPTADLRRGCRLLLALGRGCGLYSAEVIPLRAHDVRLPGNGAVVVAVRGSRAHLVCRRP